MLGPFRPFATPITLACEESTRQARGRLVYRLRLSVGKPLYTASPHATEIDCAAYVDVNAPCAGLFAGASPRHA